MNRYGSLNYCLHGYGPTMHRRHHITAVKVVLETASPILIFSAAIWCRVVKSLTFTEIFKVRFGSILDVTLAVPVLQLLSHTRVRSDQWVPEMIKITSSQKWYSLQKRPTNLVFISTERRNLPEMTSYLRIALLYCVRQHQNHRHVNRIFILLNELHQISKNRHFSRDST